MSRDPYVPGRAVAALLAGVVFAVGGFALTRLSVSTEITHFLPGGEESEMTRLSQALAQSEIIKTIIITIEADGPDTAAAAAGDLTERLKAVDGVAWVRSGVGDELQDSVRDLYLPRSLYFLSDRPETLDFTEDGLRERAQELKRQLALPTSTLIRPLVTKDPFLSFFGQLRRMQDARVGELKMHEGRFVTPDGEHGILFLATQASPFRGQAPLFERIDATFAEVKSRHPGVRRMEQSAVHRFAISAERSIKADITRISVVSTIGILVLFLVLFRSLRYVLLAFVPVGTGIFGALAASAFGFSKIHGITLAFGCSMIGVCIDYGVHLVNHHALAAGATTPAGSLGKVWPGLLLGATTTVAGLLGLIWTTFPGIQEIAVFSVVGVITALATTRLVIPAFMPASPQPVPLQSRLAEKLGALMAWVVARRRLVLLGWLPVLALGAAGYPRLRWNDQLSALNHMNPDLLAEDERVRGRVSRMEGGQIVAVIGENEEAALEKNDQVYRILEQGDRVETFRSLHTFLWSSSLQEANLDKLRNPNLKARFTRAFEAEGFQPAAFSPFLESLTSTPSAPLRFEDLNGSPLGPLVRPFRSPIGDKVALFTFVRGVRDVEGLKADLASVEGAFFFDQQTFLTGAYGRYRTRALELVAVGLVGVFLIVLFRYRRLRLALAAFLPALVAAGSTLGLLGLLGMEANLMHLVALLLVLSIGVDYGVFMVEHRSHADVRAATLLSIVVACSTTMLSFGTLAMSSNPALRALGVAVGVGVMLALLLAPTALGFFAEGGGDG